MKYAVKQSGTNPKPIPHFPIPNPQSGFTIVELLVVIVVIGILAALTIVAYTGISQKAIVASLQSDLDNASKQLKLFQVDNMAYPNSVTDCPTPSTGNLCLKVSSGNTYSSYSANNISSPQSFTLTATNGSNIYKVTNTTAPIALTSAPLTPVADWLATTQGDHYGNFYDLVTHNYATVTRAGAKTIYDPATSKIYDVPANQLGVNPRSDGKGGSEAVVEESRTNYLLNSYFNADANSDGLSDNWSSGVSNSTNTVSRSTTNSVYGTVQKFKAAHVDNATTGWPQIYQASAVGTFAAGETGSGTIWYRNLSKQGTGAILRIQAAGSSGTTLGGSTDFTLTVSSSWQKATVTYPTLPANTSKMILTVIANGQTTNGDYFEVELAAAQLEKGAFATSYIPTTTVTVTRSADNVTVPTTGWNASSGTYVVVSGGTRATALGLLGVAATSGGNNYTSLTMADILYVNIKDGAGAWAQARAGTSGGITVPHVYATSFQAGTNGVVGYADGVAGSTTGTFGTPRGAISSTAKLGLDLEGYYANGPISRLLTYSSALSSADVTTVTNAIKDGP